MTAGRRVTLRDVARAADVSIGTASQALNGGGRMRPATRTAIVDAAARLGYSANPAARHLRGGRIGAIGVYLPENSTGLDYYMNFAFGAVEAARAHKFAITLVTP